MVPLLTGLVIGLGAALAAAQGTISIGPGELRVELRDGAATPERRAAALFAAEVQRRTRLRVPIGAGASRYTLVIGTGLYRLVPGVGQDGFRLTTAPDEQGRLYCFGQSPSGVVAGVGKLLRLMRYGERSLDIPQGTWAQRPAMPVRGIYFATHFGNFYHVAPLAEIDRVIEGFALWGGNSLCVWFDMHHFSGIADPAAQAHLARLRHFGETAHSLGMQFGLTFIANEGYGNSPPELREQNAPGAYGCELCPSKPEGLRLIGKWQAEEFEAFPQVDFIWTWPYDQGGCWCDQCRPWGANGFLRASVQLARLYHERFPKGQVWLSTWLLDHWPGETREYDGLLRYFREKRPSWCAGIIAGTHGDFLPAALAGRPEPQRYPLTCFPEISMYQMAPWGGYGANPLPGFCGRLEGNLRGKVVGGWPYSEGIYEDLNKWTFARFYWEPDRPMDEVLAEYASYYLGPGNAADAVRLFHLLEQTHPRTNWRTVNLAQADEAWALAEAIDGRLARWAKTSWRWRLIYVRAAIDHLLRTQGYRTPEAQAALTPLCQEITRLYHATATGIRPPDFPRQPDPANLAYGRPVTVSSTHPDCRGSEPNLTDGVLSSDDGENFWASDPAVEKTAWVAVDLGESRPIKEVRLQFRGLYGQFWFVPSSVAVEVSEDGERYERVLDSTDLPKEGAAYSPEFRVHPVGRTARYLRLLLGESQHQGDQYAGTIELTEVEVR